jgi:hypothetical protein
VVTTVEMNLTDALAQLRGTRFQFDEHVQVRVGCGVAPGPRAEHTQIEDRHDLRQATLEFVYNLPIRFC